MFNTRNHRTKDLLNIWKLSLMCKYLASASKVIIKNIWWLNNTKVPNMITLLSLCSLVHDSASTMLLGRVQGCNRCGQLGAEKAQGAGDLSTGSYPNTDTQLLTASPPRPPGAGSLTRARKLFPKFLQETFTQYIIAFTKFTTYYSEDFPSRCWCLFVTLCQKY